MTPKPTLPSQQALYQVFETIVASPALSKQVLATPAAVFAQHGLAVADPAYVDAEFFNLFPQLQKHFTLGAAAQAHPDALAACESPRCIACQSGMAITASVAIAAALVGFPEDTPAIEALADLVGLDADTIIDIINSGGKSIKNIIDGICQSLGTC